MNKKLVYILICMFFFVTIFSFVKADNDDKNMSDSDNDWWITNYHDPQRTGYTTSTGPDTNNVMTQFESPTSNIPLSVCGGILYSPGGGIQAYNANNGLYIKDTFYNPTGAITIADGKMFFHTSLFGLICLDANPQNWGYAIWTNQIGLSTNSPILYGGYLYTTHTYNGEKTNITCLDPNSGTIEWDVCLDSYLEGNIALFGYNIYAIAEKEAICINITDGQIQWQNSVITDMDDTFSFNTPAILNEKLYAISQKGTIYCLDILDEGYVEWEYCTNQYSFFESPSLGYNNVYIATLEALYCLNATTGSLEWIIDNSARTPIIADGKVYAYVDNKLKCFNAIDGNEIWSFTEPTNLCPIIANDVLYYASQGTIYLFNDDHNAPNVPSFTGPYFAQKNIPISFYVNCDDPDGDMIYYIINWDEGTEEFGPFPSGIDQEITHVFRNPHYEGNKTFDIYCWAKDDSEYDLINHISTGPHNVFVENHAPETPMVTGPEQAYVGEWFTLEFSISDPDDDINLALGMFIDPRWGWEGNYESGSNFQKQFKVDNICNKTYRFKLGERTREHGSVMVESEATEIYIKIIEKPVIAIKNVTADMGKISAEIGEISGKVYARDINWSIDVTGGIFGFINIHSNGFIEKINESENIFIKTDKPIFGIGYTDILITVTTTYLEAPLVKSARAFVFGSYIIGLDENDQLSLKR